MPSSFMRQMAEAKDVTQRMKSDEQIKWVGMLNNIKACSEEIVSDEIVYE